jgi:hypothetical protein
MMLRIGSAKADTGTMLHADKLYKCACRPITSRPARISGKGRRQEVVSIGYRPLLVALHLINDTLRMVGADAESSTGPPHGSDPAPGGQQSAILNLDNSLGPEMMARQVVRQFCRLGEVHSLVYGRRASGENGRKMTASTRVGLESRLTDIWVKYD